MSNDLPPQRDTLEQDVSPGVRPEINHALVALCTAVLPVWGRQLATSRAQSEAAVSEMLAAFAEIGPHLDMAVRQSHQITAALGDGGITQLALACENELTPLLAELEPHAVSAVRRVMGMIRQSVDALEQVAHPFEHETQMVGQQVERMYIGFQYQDRISQMMTLLHEDIQRLQTVMLKPGADSQALSSEAWLARLESQYAMEEQRQGHAVETLAGNTLLPDSDSDTTFF